MVSVLISSQYELILKNHWWLLNSAITYRGFPFGSLHLAGLFLVRQFDFFCLEWHFTTSAISRHVTVPSNLSIHFSVVGSRGQQAKQGSRDLPLPSKLLQLIWGYTEDTEVFVPRPAEKYHLFSLGLPATPHYKKITNKIGDKGSFGGVQPALETSPTYCLQYPHPTASKTIHQETWLNTFSKSTNQQSS